jgi:hypothetical protein
MKTGFNYQLPLARFLKNVGKQPAKLPARVLVPILSIRLNDFFSPRVSVLSK